MCCRAGKGSGPHGSIDNRYHIKSILAYHTAMPTASDLRQHRIFLSADTACCLKVVNRQNTKTRPAAIRSLPKADAAQVPIVAMTANAFAKDVQPAKTAGMNEHAAKPLDMKRLCEILHRRL